MAKVAPLSFLRTMPGCEMSHVIDPSNVAHPPDPTSSRSMVYAVLLLTMRRHGSVVVVVDAAVVVVVVVAAAVVVVTGEVFGNAPEISVTPSAPFVRTQTVFNCVSNTPNANAASSGHQFSTEPVSCR